MKQKIKAFTLIELLVVIVIIGVLATVSTATFSGYSKRARLAKGLAFAAQLERTLSIDLKGWWDFDEGSGTVVKGKDPRLAGEGTIVDAAWSMDTPFGRGYSLSFNGTTSSVGVSNHDNYLNDKMTMSAWIKPNATPGQNGFFLSSLRFSGGAGSRHDGVLLAANESSSRISARVFSADYNLFDLIAPVSVFDEWMHVAFALDGDVARLYINGELMDEHVEPGRVFTNPDSTFTIGRYDFFPAFYFDGFIDDVRIYHDVIDFN